MLSPGINIKGGNSRDVTSCANEFGSPDSKLMLQQFLARFLIYDFYQQPRTSDLFVKAFHLPSHFCRLSAFICWHFYYLRTKKNDKTPPCRSRSCTSATAPSLPKLHLFLSHFPALSAQICKSLRMEARHGNIFLCGLRAPSSDRNRKQISFKNWRTLEKAYDTATTPLKNVPPHIHTPKIS